MGTPSADIAGYADAQRRLRKNFGEECLFQFPAAWTWPPNTQIDPETQRPYDPVVEPVATTQVVNRVRCNVVFKAINRAGFSNEAQATAVGWFSEGSVMLIADIDDKAKIEGARDVVVRGQTWEIHSTFEDGIGGVQRFCVIASKRDL